MARPVPDNLLKPPPLLAKIVEPFQEFVRQESFAGILLLASTIVALIWANSTWGSSYAALWDTPFTIGFGETLALQKPLLLWINDGLMAIFFFVVGLEIKREILVGELSSPRHAAVPIAAAIGGMVCPALIYFSFTAGTEEVHGWGIPMATDIAFSLGILTLLGNRVPLALKVFLTALAIVDDIGAVVVIALFYTEGLSIMSLLIGMAFFAVLILCNRLRLRDPLIYSFLGAGLWVAFLKSGIHATIAGVVVAAAIPVRKRIDEEEFVRKGHAFLEEFQQAGAHQNRDIMVNSRQHGAIQSLEILCEHVMTPLQRMEHVWHRWVTYGIMPLFALANAGVVLHSDLTAAFAQPVALGVICGLVIGKQLGIAAAVWIVVRLGMAAMPQGISWKHIYGVGWLAGIGFTMSLFIANLAFNDMETLAVAKVGIFTASLISGVVGWLILNAIESEKEKSDPVERVSGVH